VNSTSDVDDLAKRALAGDRSAVARLLTIVEIGGPAAREVARSMRGHTGRAWTVGITGAPGSGKSTLTDRLVTRVRADAMRVGVLAIDPTSPFSGGAILGDRVRMQEHATDEGVFIRSMATRGHLGGLAAAAPAAARVLDAVGLPWIVIETVGVGQVEVEIAGHADTTVVVVNPGWGDAVQAAKAGLLEIADVFVVNKADRPGVRDTVRELESTLDLSSDAYRPPVVETVATTGEGVDDLWTAIAAHRAHVEASGTAQIRRRQRVADEVRALVIEGLTATAMPRCSGPEFDAIIASVERGERDPYAAAAVLIAGN
jgi:LAO/AO transport system kinase